MLVVIQLSHNIARGGVGSGLRLEMVAWLTDGLTTTNGWLVNCQENFLANSLFALVAKINCVKSLYSFCQLHCV